MRSVEMKLALAAAMALLAAMPASADDGRRHVMTPTQRIDMVRDLPDVSAFEKDGLQYDLGYIYPIHTVNGASVAGGSGESGFVLYHDDRYVRADSGVMGDLEMVLGENPTQGYTPPKAVNASATTADPWSANDTSDAAKGQPITSSPSRNSAAHRGIGIVGTLFLFFVVLFIRLRLFRDLVIGGMLAAIASVVRRRDEAGYAPGPSVTDDRIASQAAAQRARLDALSGAAASSFTPASGGFGRKQV